MRRGAISLAAWKETGQNGKPWWKTVKLQRSYESPKGSGNWQHGDIGGNDVAEAILLLQAFHLKCMVIEPEVRAQAPASTGSEPPPY